MVDSRWSMADGRWSARQHIDTARNTMVLLDDVTGAIMSDDMGTFRIDIEIENPARPGQKRG
jgi:hypothetical protein